MDGQPSWDHWRTFLAVVDEGSLSAAARALGLTQPTVGRHVDALEAVLQAALFIRAPVGLIATDLALSLVPQARTLAAAAAALRRAASAPEAAEAGNVRLAASEIVGVEVLPEVLARFAAARPGIGIELSLSNRNEDLTRADADVGIRMVRPTEPALVARALGVVRLGLYVHRRYAKSRGVPDTVEALAAHALIGPETGRALAGVTLGGRAVTPDLFLHRSDSDLAQLGLLRAGVGIGVCQVGVAAGDPDLLAVLPGMVRFTLEPWLVMHEDLRANRRVRLLYDHLAAELERLWKP